MKQAFFTLLALAFTATIVFAQEAPVKQQTKTQAGALVQVTGGVGPNFVDADGDGICDNPGVGLKTRASKGNKGGFGPGDGSGNKGVGPKNGTGYGSGSGSGDCDGTGPKGLGRGRK